MLITNTTIKSFTRKIYAMKGDEVSLLWTSGDVGCYLNKETNETFPTLVTNIMQMLDDSKIVKERDEEKTKKQKPTNQLSLW